MAECKKRVGQGVVAYPCIIPIPDGRTAHDGPCAATENQASLSARERWERGGEARATLAQTQSAPMTFAEENRAHAPSPVPGSNLQPAEHRAAHQPKVGDFGEQAGLAGACLHPFGAAIEDATTGEVYCRECSTQLRPPRAQPPAQSTLASFVAGHAAPIEGSFSPEPVPAIPPIEVGHLVLFVPNDDRPNVAMLARVDSLLDSPPGAFKATSVLDGSQWSVLGSRGVLQVYPGDSDIDGLIASLGWPPRGVRVVDAAPEPGAVMETGIVADPPPVLLTADGLEPTKQREGDQPLPVQGNPRPAVQDLIIEAMHESKRVGTERYGQPLKPMNGRDTLLDATEEARDLYVYLTALGEERREVLERAERIYTRLVAERATLQLPPEMVEDLRLLVLWLRGTPQT